mgnify:CR=1 FL=1
MLLIIISIVHIYGCCRYTLLDQPCEVFGLVWWHVVIVVHNLIIIFHVIIIVVSNSLPLRSPAIHFRLYSLVVIINNRLDWFDRLAIVALFTQLILLLYLLYCFLLAAKLLFIKLLLILILLTEWLIMLLMVLPIVGLLLW